MRRVFAALSVILLASCGTGLRDIVVTTDVGEKIIIKRSAIYRTGFQMDSEKIKKDLKNFEAICEDLHISWREQEREWGNEKITDDTRWKYLHKRDGTRDTLNSRPDEIIDARLTINGESWGRTWSDWNQIEIVCRTAEALELLDKKGDWYKKYFYKPIHEDLNGVRRVVDAITIECIDLDLSNLYDWGPNYIYTMDEFDQFFRTILLHRLTKPQMLRASDGDYSKILRREAKKMLMAIKRNDYNIEKRETIGEWIKDQICSMEIK